MIYWPVKGLHVGTSGWVYKGWAGAFYPADLAENDRLTYYAQHFGTVEINATFYRLPSESMVRGWDRKAPPGFIYAVKGSRFITQMKKLKVEPESIAIFFERISPLKAHLGPILWQLPPSLGIDLPRLDNFLNLLPAGYRYAVEFRHPSWMEDNVFALLKKHNAAHVHVSSMRMPMNLTVTSDLVYIRFHGLESGAAHDYTRDELKPWAAALPRRPEAQTRSLRLLQQRLECPGAQKCGRVHLDGRRALAVLLPRGV